MNKIRISFTLLSLWDRKEYDQVADYYSKKRTFTTDAMELGQAYDTLVNATVNKTGKLPPDFGGLQLNKPITQLKLEANLDDEIEIVGMPDVLDAPTLIEIKTGVTNSMTYIKSMQIGMYALLCELNNIKIDKAIVIRHDQYQKKTDWSMRWITPELIKQTKVQIYSKEPEIREFLEGRGLL